MSSSYEDSDDDSFDDSLSELESLSFDTKPKNRFGTGNGGNGGGRGGGRKVERIEPLMFRDENPPRRWVGQLENIDTEEAAFELRQQVTDLTMTGASTNFDALDFVQNTDPIFANLYQRQLKEKEKQIPKNIRKYGTDAELDITSVFFDPVLFLSQVHKNTTHERLELGIRQLANTAATRSQNIKRLVSLHFGQFVHCKDTIDLIQSLLKPELPPEHTRLDLLASRMQNLPWLLNTFSPQQLEQLYSIITNKRQQQNLMFQQQLQQRNVHHRHGYNHFTFDAATSSSSSSSTSQTVTTTSGPPSSSSTASTISSVYSGPSGSAGAITANDMASPFGFNAPITQSVSDKSRIGRLQLVLGTVAEKTDLIYSPLLTRRTESDHIRSALTIFRKYKLLLELPMRMRQHINNGRVDRLVHDSQRINVLKISRNPLNYILQQALTECQQIRSYFAQILLERLNDPRHNLYSQQRTMSYLFQLEDKIDPSWYYLERQCLHVGNLLDRAYYDSSFNTTHSTFVSLDTEALRRQDAKARKLKEQQQQQKSQNALDFGRDTVSSAALQIGPDLLQRLQEYGGNDSSTDNSLYKYRDGEYGDDDFDEDYNMWHNGPSASPVGANGSFFSQTVSKINQIAPPTSYMEYDPKISGQSGTTGAGDCGVPLFMRKPQHLTQAHAELISTNLLHIFSLHIQPLLKLCYNVGNGTLFDVIKSSGDSKEVDISSLTINRHFISSSHLERLTTLLSHLTSKLILYLSSLCIPGMDLGEISGFAGSILQSISINTVKGAQMAERRRLDSLDLAYPSKSPRNPVNALSQRNSASSQGPHGWGRFSSPTSANTTALALLGNNNSQQKTGPNGRPLYFGDDTAIDTYRGTGPGLLRPSGGNAPGVSFGGRNGISASPLGALPHHLGGTPQLQQQQSGSGRGLVAYQPGSRIGTGPAAAIQNFNSPNAMNGGVPFSTFTGLPPPLTGLNQQQQQQQQPKPAGRALAAHISSISEDDVYYRHTALHTVALENTTSVLPRNPDDPIQPLPVANFSHIVLHLLSTVLLSMVNNPLALLEPKILDPLLSFYVNLHRTAQQFLLISATVQISTLKETFTLTPASIYHHNQSTTLPIQFQHVIDTYLQSMVLLPSKQLLFRALLYFNSPPQFNLISDYSELVLTFADRLHSIAIPQNPTRLIGGTASSAITDLTTETTTITQSGSAEAVLTTTTEEIVQTKVITKRTIIGPDGQQQVVMSEEILEDEISPTVEVKSKTLKAAAGTDDFFARDQFIIDPAQNDLNNVSTGSNQPKAVTISRFGRELLSLAEQLNYNEHSSDPYSIGDVVAANAQNIYNSAQTLQSSVLNQLNPMVTAGMSHEQIQHITAALTAGLSVDGIWNNARFPNALTSALGDDRVLLSVLSNCIHTAQTIVPRAWRSLAELIQQSWPAKELLEMSFYLNSNGNGSNNQPSQQLLDPATRTKYTAVLKNDLGKLKQKYNPTGQSGTVYHTKFQQRQTSDPKQPHRAQLSTALRRKQPGGNAGSRKKVAFSTGLTDSEDDLDDTDTDGDFEGAYGRNDTDNTSMTATTSDDSSYSDMSSDMEALLGDGWDDNDEDDVIINALGLQDEIWSSLSPRQQNYINTAVVGGLGVSMSLALDNSYRKVQGVYLQLQNIVVQRYILNKTNIINSYLYDSLFRGGINWRKAPVPTHVREFLYSILQHLVEAKSEMVLFQNIDFASILTTIIENTIVTWCHFVKSVRVLSYNAAMQLALETNFLCRSMNRYTTPYAISLCQDLLILLHSYIEETICTERVNTTFGGISADGAGGGAMYTGEDGFDSQLFDAVSRLGMFSTINKRITNNNSKVDENTGYEFSTSVSPLQSMLIQQRDQRNIMQSRRGSNTYGTSVIGGGGSTTSRRGGSVIVSTNGADRNEVSLLQASVFGNDEKRKQLLKQTQSRDKTRTNAVTIDSDSDDDLFGGNTDDDQHQDDSHLDQEEDDDEAAMVAGVISMRDLKLYTTQQVNKDLMIQFRIHTTHLDIDNILQQSLWSTRLSFSTLRIDPEDPLLTLMLDESSKGMTPGTDLFQRTYRTPEEVVDGYFQSRYNATRLRENVRLELTQEQQHSKFVYQEWVKQNNWVYNSSLESPEFYVNLSIGQSKKYRELIAAQRNHSSAAEVKKIITKYSTTSSSSSSASSKSDFSATQSSSYGSRFGAASTLEITEENDPEPEDFGVKVTRLVTKRKEVVEKTKQPKEKKVREKKQKPSPIPENTPDKPPVVEDSSSDLEDLFPVKPKPVVEVVPEVKKIEVVETKIIKPPPAPLIIEQPPTPKPVKVPTPPPTPKPTIIEERTIVTTTTTKQQQQLKIQQEEEERRAREKELLILSQYQKKSTNLDFLDEDGPKGGIEDEFDDVDLQAINFSYKVAQKETKTAKNQWEVSSDSPLSSSEDEKPLRTLPPPLPDFSSSSESDIPEFVPKFQPQQQQREERIKKEIKAQQKHDTGPHEVQLKRVTLRSDRQRRERKTRRGKEDDDSDDDIDINLNFDTKTTTNRSARAKKIDMSDVADQQRLLIKEQQLAKKNTLRDKIDLQDQGAVVNYDKGGEDLSKLTVEEKRKRQIKMRIKRTKDGKYIDLDTGEEIDPSMFKKQLGPVGK